MGYDLQEKNAWKLSRVHDILCCRLLFYFVTSTKDTASHTVFKKVSFGQPARQESDKKNKKNVTIHWKTIPYQESLVFRVYFSSSIMELQKCSLANPCREVLEQSHVYLLGLIDIGGFGSVGYLAFDVCLFWIQLITRPRFKKGSVHKHWFLLWSLKGQRGWCEWWGYIHEKQCGYRRCSAL